MTSLTRLTSSTWGATFAQAPQLYSVIVRPALTYGSQIWAQESKQHQVPKTLVKELEAVQREALKRIVGAYKSVPLRALEHETDILLIDLYLQQLRVQHAALTANQSCQKYVRDQTEPRATSSATRRVSQRDKDCITWAERTGTPVNMQDFIPPRRPTTGEKKEKRDKVKTLKKSFYTSWKERWNGHNLSRTYQPTAAQPRGWNASTLIPASYTIAGPGTCPANIHGNLTRSQSSIATQIRTEHIGLNAYLKWRRVLGHESAGCSCGYPAQNAKHMLLFCPEWAEGRGEWLRKARNRDILSLLNDSEDVQRITSWILRRQLINQFKLSPAVEDELEKRRQKREQPQQPRRGNAER